MPFVECMARVMCQGDDDDGHLPMQKKNVEEHAESHKTKWTLFIYIYCESYFFHC